MSVYGYFFCKNGRLQEFHHIAKEGKGFYIVVHHTDGDMIAQYTADDKVELFLY
ncbi:MAG: hypothetical protein HUJ51_03420 [Eggerthellaceae bacterium]|nr:hypothetical protein [Eggerthellaceae bacterium]